MKPVVINLGAAWLPQVYDPFVDSFRNLGYEVLDLSGSRQLPTSFGLQKPFLAVAGGFREPHASKIARLESWGIPVYVFDNGWLARHPYDPAKSPLRPDQYQYSFRSGKRCVSFPIITPLVFGGPDRARRYRRLEEVVLGPNSPLGRCPRPAKDSGEVLVLGQTPGDASHGFNKDELGIIYARMCEHLQAAEYRVCFRAHPQEPVFPTVCSMIRLSSAALVPLHEEVARCGTVVTISSTGIIEAALLGADVGVCDPWFDVLRDCEHTYRPKPFFGDFRAPLETRFSKWDPERILDIISANQFNAQELADGFAARSILRQLTFTHDYAYED